MKKIYIAVAIFLFIPLLIAASRIYLGKTISGLSAMLGTAQSLEKQGQTQKAEQEVRRFTQNWEKHKKVLETFVKHAELDPVTQELAKLEPYLSADEKAEFAAEADTISAQLEHIRDTEKFSYQNIL